MGMSDFQRDLEAVISKHTMENESGTPDYILAEYLTGCLVAYNKTLQDRAKWRGESVELPALQNLRKKKVPLVMYTDGQRNEIGEAEVEQWPGEVRVSGTITGVVPMFSLERGEHDYSIG